MDRREFLTGSMGAALLATMPADVFAQTGNAPRSKVWDSGRVRHLLPTVSDTRMLIKASFTQPLSASPTLRVGGRPVPGRMNDTRGEFWQFHIDGLESGRRYALSLAASGGAALCQPWDLSTFPDLSARPAQFLVLFFTCAGGHDGFGFLPAAIRSRLLCRALSFRPQAAVANGDHVYWDLLAPRASPLPGASPQAARRAGTFTRSALVFGDKNETVLKLAAGPQIVPVYGTGFRSTPVFFLQDDHDHFHNDEATADIVAFSGDLHAVAVGQMLRCGALDLKANPITTVLTGPIGTSAGLWPSAFRGVGPTPPAHLDMRETIKPIEQHGFTPADFLPDRIGLRFFKWDVKTQSPDAIDSLDPPTRLNSVAQHRTAATENEDRVTKASRRLNEPSTFKWSRYA